MTDSVPPSIPADDEQRLRLAVDSAREAGDWILDRFGGKIPSARKGDGSVVTDLDSRSERMIVEHIRSRFPEHIIIGEELTPDAVIGPDAWAVDPIDGTRNFAAGVPLWAVSVAALRDREPVAASIYLPVSGEMYSAAHGAGAWLNGERISVGEIDRLSTAVAMTDLVPSDRNVLPHAVQGGLIGAVRRTRMFGSVCCSLAYVAAGRFELYYRPRVHLWDIAAGVLIVREAGGLVRTLEGEEWNADSRSIIVANEPLMEQFLTRKRELEDDN